MILGCLFGLLMYLVFMMLVVPIWLQFVLIKRLIKLLDKTLATESFWVDIGCWFIVVYSYRCIVAFTDVAGDRDH